MTIEFSLVNRCGYSPNPFRIGRSRRIPWCELWIRCGCVCLGRLIPSQEREFKGGDLRTNRDATCEISHQARNTGIVRRPVLSRKSALSMGCYSRVFKGGQSHRINGNTDQVFSTSKKVYCACGVLCAAFSARRRLPSRDLLRSLSELTGSWYLGLGCYGCLETRCHIELSFNHPRFLSRKRPLLEKSFWSA